MPFKSKMKKTIMKACCKISILFNILMFCFGITYLIIPFYNILFDIFGIVLISSWLINILILYLDEQYLVKTSSIGKQINRFTYYYIILFIVGILVIVNGVFFLTIIIEGNIIIFFMHLAIFIGLFDIAIMGIYLAVITYINLEKRGVWIFE